MIQNDLFKTEDLDCARALGNAGAIQTVLFSEGTYQVEVLDEDSFWPFLQLDDEGKLQDFFCTCEKAEIEGKCPHLAAAYLEIYRDSKAPLHLRFRQSLWNKLCQIAAHRHGYEVDVLEKIPERFRYEIPSPQGKGLLFYLEAKSARAQEVLQEILHNRAVETEETSLKFSNLSQEEISLWKQGRPSHHLRYELSFWSDIAKRLMLLQNQNLPYSITFDLAKNGLPKMLHIHFDDIQMGVYIAEVNWADLIPTLNTVHFPLKVYEFQDREIHQMRYDSDQKKLLIEATPTSFASNHQALQLGEWTFLPEVGFFPSEVDPILKKEELKGEEISDLFENHIDVVDRFLVGSVVHHQPIEPSYEIRLDSKNHLHITSFLFEKGDITDIFYPWVYLQDCGFYKLESPLFKKIDATIPKEDVGNFISSHRNFLSQFEGFQTHLASIETRIHFSLDASRNLSFETESSDFENGHEIVDFGEWLYIKSRGFYQKGTGKPMGFSPHALTISREKIPQFIQEHREDLEQIKGFFSSRCPIEQAGLEVLINESGNIVLSPLYQLYTEYRGRNVEIFGTFAYVDKEGFSEIPSKWRLPERYQKELEIPESEESAFINVTLKQLKPFLIHLDSRLREPSLLRLKIHKIQKESTGDWKVKLSYQSEWGEESLTNIKSALGSQKSYLRSQAGLLFFKDPRYNWLRQLPKTRLEEEHITLTTLEWMRLSIFEELLPPRGQDPESVESRKLLEDLRSLKTAELLNLKGLTSTLRPYQKIGVEWLWFLYCHGLSGMLCDDMGLGKTHQAMALLAAVRNAKKPKKAKFLVVCPTSVIYHWEDLLKTFLPKVKVHVFYGVSRTLKYFRSQYDLLLTTYGTFRSEKKVMARYKFDVAILDELQIAKNAHSQTHHALKLVNAKTQIGLSGTPLENRLSELKALFDIILPGYFPPPALYRELFVNPIEKHQDQEKKSLLTQMCRPFLLRRKKSEVLADLPEKIEEINHCVLSEEQKTLYQKAFLKEKELLMQELKEEEKPLPYLHVFALLNQLKQICNHPALVKKGIKDYTKHKSGKWELFVELLDEVRDSGQKLVVFSQYLGMLDIIESYLKERGIGFAALRGSTRDRRGEIERFRDDPDCEVFVGSLKAAGVGIDLTSASVVIHYDRWWNPSKENQATDRVHRIGQKRGVQVFKLVTRGTIEEHIHRLIEKKIGLIESIVGYDDQDQIKELNRKELIALFNQINRDIENFS